MVRQRLLLVFHTIFPFLLLSNRHLITCKAFSPSIFPNSSCSSFFLLSHTHTFPSSTLSCDTVQFFLEQEVTECDFSETQVTSGNWEKKNSWPYTWHFLPFFLFHSSFFLYFLVIRTRNDVPHGIIWPESDMILREVYLSSLSLPIEQILSLWCYLSISLFCWWSLHCLNQHHNEEKGKSSVSRVPVAHQIKWLQAKWTQRPPLFLLIAPFHFHSPVIIIMISPFLTILPNDYMNRCSTPPPPHSSCHTSIYIRIVYLLPKIFTVEIMESLSLVNIHVDSRFLDSRAEWERDTHCKEREEMRAINGNVCLSYYIHEY